jgi:glycosyltransferase involved in cell wall biosynthesis
MIKFVNNASVTKDVSGSTRGVNIYGFANKISGLGQNARQVLRAINNTDISYNYLDLFSASKEFKFIEPTINHKFKTNLFCCNPDIDLTDFINLKKNNHKKNIGLWAWEVEVLPEYWIKYSELFDEIWTISNFTKSIFEKELPNKIIKSLNIPGAPFKLLDKSTCKQTFGINSNTFLCSFVFDSFSDINRKNPLHVIESFESSLGDEDSVLLIKCQNLSQENRDILLNYPKTKKVKFIFETFSDELMNHLFCATDLYISLHRSEGSGLTIMEALSVGTPCLVTNYGGCLDFCLPEFCELVDYNFIEITEDIWYKNNFFKDKEVFWANPIVNDASNKIKKIFDNYDDYLIKTNELKNFIENNYNLENMSIFLKNNL